MLSLFKKWKRFSEVRDGVAKPAIENEGQSKWNSAKKGDISTQVEKDVMPVESCDVSKTSIEYKFLDFHNKNPHIYDRLREMAFTLKGHGRKKYGIASLFEVLRWQHATSTTSSDFKLNNNYRAYYARLLMENEPELDGFFHVRVQHGTSL